METIQLKTSRSKDPKKTIEVIFENKNGTLYYGDALKTLQALPDESVDLIITSPPYNIHNHHDNNRKTGCYKDSKPEGKYQLWQIAILLECFRVLKPNGSMFYNHKNRITKGIQISPYEWLLKTDFVIKQEIVWDNGGQNHANIRLYPTSERIYWLTKSPTTTLTNVHKLRDIVTRKRWKPRGTKGEHTRAFPEQFPLDIIDCFPNAKVILDPFMGSGTTAVAARKKDKQWIGIEKLKKFCNLTITNVSTLGLFPRFLSTLAALIQRSTNRISNNPRSVSPKAINPNNQAMDKKTPFQIERLIDDANKIRNVVTLNENIGSVEVCILVPLSFQPSVTILLKNLREKDPDRIYPLLKKIYFFKQEATVIDQLIDLASKLQLGILDENLYLFLTLQTIDPQWN